MDKHSLRIVYMGTPDFAVEPLRCLVAEGFNVVGVISMPDKPAGRGHKIQFSPVKQFALDNHLPLLQPVKLKDPDFLSQLAAWQADLQVVVAFRMLPQVVWAMPRLGTFNLHASLLPQYRGAAPINWAIINGEVETGLTTFFLTQEIDTGKIIQQVRIPIADADDFGILHDKLMVEGARLLLQTVQNILDDKVTPIPQEQLYKSAGTLNPAPKIFKETCQINFNQPVKKVYDFVRGLSPCPSAWAMLQAPDGTQLSVKIFRSAKILQTPTVAPGSIVTDGKSFIHVATTDGYLNLLSLLLPGKKRMDVTDLLRGFSLNSSYRFVFVQPAQPQV